MGKSEASAQSEVVLAAQSQGRCLLRNNSGAVTTDDGRHIRFGLGNESAKVNEAFKSSDLIGIRRVVVTPEMVGQVIGVFDAVEVKRPGWVFRPSDKRAVAQQKFGDWVRYHGGTFQFATKPEDLV